MITIQTFSAQNALIFKAARLCALQDTPSAFCATYAEESQLTDADWIERATQANGERSIFYLAMEGDEVRGIAGVLPDPDDATRVRLVSMWTAPTHRRHGIGQLLVNKILDWAGRHGIQTLELHVASDNQSAISFYQWLEFSMTGRTVAYPSGSAAVVHEMTRPITPGV
ncbi:MAG TPA: GNAT family N-acetyltransferase [Acidobacteriaceae bacterium]|jgi:GNAT superfamily N-acetyltransferase|nr:GNAT family N-acetyltransferase [Acidobacteriaceae bacterium]